jgi:CBS domain-containing protein
MAARRKAARKPSARPRRAPRRSPARTRKVDLPLAYNVRVGDVVSSPAILIGTEGTLLDAVMLMRTHNVSGLPVIDAEGAVVGVLSQKDVARIVAGSSLFPEIKGLLDVLMIEMTSQPAVTLQKMRTELERTRVKEVMSSPPFVIRPDAPLEFAAEVMRDNSINRLPVVEDRRLVGVVTRTDLVRALIRSPAPRAGR